MSTKTYTNKKLNVHNTPRVDTFVKAFIRFYSPVIAASRRGQLRFAFGTAFLFDSLS